MGNRFAMNRPAPAMRIGVIGVGKLGSSLVEGFCSHPDFASHNCHLYLSSRGRGYVKSLRSRFPETLNVCESNQEVVEHSDIVMLCVLPRQLPEVCAELTTTKEGQIIVSCVAGYSIAETQSFFKHCGTQKLCKAIPLPASAFQQGTTILYPPIETPKLLFNRLGACFCPKSEEEMVVYTGGACIMGTLYKVMQTCQEWGESKGVDSKTHQSYLAHVFQTFTFEAVQRHEETRLFQSMVEEQTPGGLNEGIISYMQKEGCFAKLKFALDQVETRSCGSKTIQGKLSPLKQKPEFMSPETYHKSWEPERLNLNHI